MYPQLLLDGILHALNSWHHEPQPYAFGDERELKFLSLRFDCRNERQALLKECCLKQFPHAATLGFEGLCLFGRRPTEMPFAGREQEP